MLVVAVAVAVAVVVLLMFATAGVAGAVITVAFTRSTISASLSERRLAFFSCFVFLIFSFLFFSVYQYICHDFFFNLLPSMIRCVGSPSGVHVPTTMPFFQCFTDSSFVHFIVVCCGCASLSSVHARMGTGCTQRDPHMIKWIPHGIHKARLCHTGLPWADSQSSITLHGTPWTDY